MIPIVQRRQEMSNFRGLRFGMALCYIPWRRATIILTLTTPLAGFICESIARNVSRRLLEVFLASS